MKLGDYIQQYRAEHGLSMRKFADLSGMSPAYISMLEKGENPSTHQEIEVSLPYYRKIAVATRVTMDQLFEILGPDAPVSLKMKLPENPSMPFSQDVIDMVNMRIEGLEFEKALLAAYRAADSGTKAAVRKLLDIQPN